MYIKRHTYREEAGDGTGGSGNGGDGNGAGGDSINDKSGKSGAGDGAGNAAQRPDYIPENFWDAKENKVNLEALAKSQKDSRLELETLKTSYKAPDKAEAYKLPTGVDVKDDDKVIALARVAAQKSGLSQTQFEKFVSEFAPEALKQELFAPEPIDKAAELAKIGQNGEAIFQAVEGWGKSLINENIISNDEFVEIFQMNSTAEGIKAMNKLREYFGGQRIPSAATPESGATSAKEWYTKRMEKNDKGEFKYDVDPAFRQKMEEEAKTVFGDKPSHSSMPGFGV